MLAALFFAPEAPAQEAMLPLPSMAACNGSSHALLPEKWHGAFLMAPFAKAQLALADIANDSSLSAMRVRLYGLKHGSLDLLVKGRKTYVLGQGGSPAVSCRDMGDTGLRPLPRDWVQRGAVCEGTAPVGGTAVEWWKTPSSSRGSANWIWYKASDRSPFRLMVTQPDDRLSILGWYSFNYRVRFEPVQDAGLKEIAAACEANAEAAKETGRPALQRMIADMERSEGRADTDIAALAPEIDTTCAAGPLPRWPEHAAMAGWMTPPGFQGTPLPTGILYDGSQLRMRTRSFWAGTRLATDDALLLDGYGFSVARETEGRPYCSGSLPGAVRPDWPETGGCSCEAAIKGDTELTPFGPARIMMCPMTAPRLLWAWFGPRDRPMVFMETSAPADLPEGVLTLIDYTAWEPGHIALPGAFAAPAECPAPEPAKPGPKPRSCGACHQDRGASH
jgi:hypothetical protein